MEEKKLKKAPRVTKPKERVIMFNAVYTYSSGQTVGINPKTRRCTIAVPTDLVGLFLYEQMITATKQFFASEFKGLKLLYFHIENPLNLSNL